MKAYAAMRRFRPGAALRPWLLRIVVNEARNRRKAASRRAALALRTVDPSASENAAPSPETITVAAAERQRLLTAIESLREEDRVVIAYRYFLDLSEAEMAEALQCPRGTIKSRLARALPRLREQLNMSPDAEEEPVRVSNG